MFIELTDHLRCPAAHDEQFLVLIPEVMEGRDVRRGSLGCPVCHRSFPIRDGVTTFGRAPTTDAAPTRLTSDAQAALAGLGGPGGYAVLVGGAAARADLVAQELPGIGLVLVNPPAGAPDAAFASRLMAPSLPLKSGSMRTAILGPGFGNDPAWIREAARVVLVGNRVVGEGDPPSVDGLDLAANADGVWVAVRGRGAKS
ncbi:MAG TPA: Trm112 family protein [Gemmatimonadales bacterium]|nr:Trm112 family protein [Gemmatimonadales bacterium]